MREWVVQSRFGPESELSYVWKTRTRVGPKYQRREPMAKKRPITVWYDREGDFLEVLFERKPGYFRQTSSEAVMEKVDNDGNVIGFHVQHATRLTQPLDLELAG